jgi:hypothetical protein
MIKDDSFIKLASLIISFLSERLIAFGIWAGIIVWGSSLIKKFSQKRNLLSMEITPHCKWIYLQCERHERNLNWIKRMILSLYAYSFLVYLFQSLIPILNKDPNLEGAVKLLSDFIFRFQITGFLAFSAFKLRGITLSQGAYNDFRRAGL